MDALFLKILNMSLTASWLVLAVAALRILLKKAPKSLHVLLWALVGLRLVLPISVESPVSLIPDGEPVSPNIVYTTSPQVYEELPEGSLSTEIVSPSEQPITPPEVPKKLLHISATVWIVGIALLLIYAFISYLRLMKQVSVSLPAGNNVFLCDNVTTPFILGLFRPKIYLPAHLDNAQQQHVIAHEKAHLKRKDHWWKPLGYLILCIHWFNPLIWASYILLCRDIELACDEKAIRNMRPEEKANYTETLLSCSISRTSIAACPLAFGEVAIKERIKAVLSYKKPALWIILLAAVITTAVAICFLTNPKASANVSDIENNKTIFKDVSQIVVITEHEGFTEERIENKASLLRSLKALEINETPLDESRNELRNQENKIRLRYEKSETDICFNLDCTEVWIQDGVKPSFTYEVKNPEKIRSLFNRNYETQNPCFYQSVSLNSTITEEIEMLLSGKGYETKFDNYENSAYFLRQFYKVLGVEQKDPYVFTVFILYQFAFQIYDAEGARATNLYGPINRPATVTFNILERDDGIKTYHTAEFWYPDGEPEDDIKKLDEKYPRNIFTDLWKETVEQIDSIPLFPVQSSHSIPIDNLYSPRPNRTQMNTRIRAETASRNQTDNPDVIYRTAQIYGSSGEYQTNGNSLLGNCYFLGIVMFKEYGAAEFGGVKTWKELYSVQYPIYAEFPRYAENDYETIVYHALSGPEDPVLDGLKASLNRNDLIYEPWEKENQITAELEKLCISDMLTGTGYDPIPVIEKLFHTMAKGSSDIAAEYPEECKALISLGKHTRDYIFRRFLQEDPDPKEARQLWYVLVHVLNRSAWLQTARNEETKVDNPITEEDLDPNLNDGEKAFERLITFLSDVEALFDGDHTHGNSDMEKLREMLGYT